MIIYIYNMYIIYIFKQWSNNNNHWITLSLTEPCDLHYHFSCTFSATNRSQKKNLVHKIVVCDVKKKKAIVVCFCLVWLKKKFQIAFKIIGTADIQNG